MIHVSTIPPRTKTHFRGWPRGGRAGLERFDKTRIDAGTLHGLPRVTVNGISAPTRHRDSVSFAFNYDFDFDSDLRVPLSTLPPPSSCPRFYSRTTLVLFRFFVSRLLTKMTHSASHIAPLYFFPPKADFEFNWPRIIFSPSFSTKLKMFTDIHWFIRHILPLVVIIAATRQT